jgi:hypothetical protein
MSDAVVVGEDDIGTDKVIVTSGVKIPLAADNEEIPLTSKGNRAPRLICISLL